MSKDYGRIGVLAGGPSNEREISLRSGRAVYDALIQEGLDAVFLDMHDNIHSVLESNKIDVAFIALHGRFGEDGTVQKMLEEISIPYTGSGFDASRMALDKIMSKEVFIKNSVPTPRYIVIEKDRSNMDTAVKLGLPMVIKPQSEGSSIGLTVIRHPEELNPAVDEALRYGDRALVEEYIEGRELTVGILNDSPLPVIEIITKDKVYDYKAKYSDPETQYVVPAAISGWAEEKARGLALLAHMALGCRSFSRVDMMMDELENIFILEVNTIPGMTERSLLPKAARQFGLSFSQLCIKIIEDALRVKPLRILS